MAKVILTKTLAAAAGADHRLESSGGTVGEVLGKLCDQHTLLGPHLLHANGAVKGHVMLSVNGEQVAAKDPIADDDELMVLLATAGGMGCR